MGSNVWWREGVVPPVNIMMTSLARPTYGATQEVEERRPQAAGQARPHRGGGRGE